MTYNLPAAHSRVWADRSSEQREVASRIPLLFGTFAAALSMMLALVTATTVRSSPFIGDVHFLFADVATLPLSVAGYFLTPFGTIAALAWDQWSQRRGLRNRNFALKPRYATALRGVAVVGFLLGIWHILNIANAISGGG